LLLIHEFVIIFWREVLCFIRFCFVLFVSLMLLFRIFGFRGCFSGFGFIKQFIRLLSLGCRAVILFFTEFIADNYFIYVSRLISFKP
jgi:hypothetical protein